MTTLRRAVVLAAGKGTRLGDLTRDRPKPLVEAGGRPLLHWILQGLKDAGVSEVCLVIGYLGSKVRESCGDGSAIGLSIVYQEQERLNGTGGALLTARGFCREEPFLMCFGDILLHPAEHYRAMLDDFEASRPDALLAANYVEDPACGAAVYFDSALRIHRIVEKPAPGTSTTSYNQAGAFVFTRAIFEALDTVGVSPRGEIELTAGVARLLEQGKTVRAYPVPAGHWLDIGTPEALAQTDRILRETL